jgi:serine-type D-Ala-D-Ala carboxypeptidase/endopeptidase (penicillin-binding protein 4)
MRLPKFLCGLVILVSLCAGSALADLAGDIRQVLSEKVLARATTGIQVVKLGQKPEDCRIVYERNSHVLLAPASNMKVLTTSSALHTLGPQFRFRTLLVKHGNDLVIWGDGDPTLGDSELMDKIGWTQTTIYDEWVAQVKKLGITSIDRVVVDDSIFDTDFLHPRWGKHQFLSYGAEVGGMNFGANVIDFTVQARKGGGTSWSTRPATSYVRVVGNTCSPGPNRVAAPRQGDSNDVTLKGTVDGACEFPVTIHDPPLYAATVFADMLAREGIAVRGGVVRDRTDRQRFAAADAAGRQQWQTVRSSETPIETVIVECNKESMNMYAEALCKRQGATGPGRNGSWASGLATTAAFLNTLGVPESEYHLDDGSGLSSENRVTANAIIRVLLQDYYSSSKDIFMKSLPIGGVDGTLRKRFDPSLHGRVLAKTGYISSACALSGYLQAKSGDWYAFTILFNNMGEPVRPLQDRIVKAIDDASVAN